MGKHLGINDDFYHLLLALTGFPALGVICYDWLFVKIPPNLQIFFSFLLPFLVLYLLQYLNEKLQEHDPKVAEKYGSLANFYKNSQRDWRLFWMGMVGGVLIFSFLAFIL